MLAETVVNNLFDFVDENFQVIMRNVILFLEVLSRRKHRFSLIFFVVRLQCLEHDCSQKYVNQKYRYLDNQISGALCEPHIFPSTLIKAGFGC